MSHHSSEQRTDFTDTLEVTGRLLAAGFEEAQAIALAKQARDLYNEVMANIPNRADLASLEDRLIRRFEALDAKLMAKFELSEEKTRRAISDAKSDYKGYVQVTAGILALVLGLIATITKIFA